MDEVPVRRTQGL